MSTYMCHPSIAGATHDSRVSRLVDAASHMALGVNLTCSFFSLIFFFLVSDLVIVVSALLKKLTQTSFHLTSYRAWLRELRAGLQSQNLDAGTGAETTEDRCLPAWSPWLALLAFLHNPAQGGTAHWVG